MCVVLSPIFLQDQSRCDKLLFERFFLILLQDYSGPILSHNLPPWTKEQAQECPTEHQDHHSHVGPIVDSRPVIRPGIPILGHRNGRTDHDTKLEDCPEDTHIQALLFLGSIGRDCSALSTPEKSGRKAAPRTTEDDELVILRVIVAPKGGGIGCIAKTSKAERPLEAKVIETCRCDQAEDGEDAVEGNVGYIGEPGGLLTSATDESDHIVHSHGHEEYTAEHAGLDSRMAVGWNRETEDVVRIRELQWKALGVLCGKSCGLVGGNNVTRTFEAPRIRRSSDSSLLLESSLSPRPGSSKQKRARFAAMFVRCDRKVQAGRCRRQNLSESQSLQDTMRFGI